MKEFDIIHKAIRNTRPFKVFQGAIKYIFMVNKDEAVKLFNRAFCVQLRTVTVNTWCSDKIVPLP